MKGYKMFYELFNQLNENDKYIFLRNVFSFQNVSLFTTTFRNDSFNDKLIIRLFSNNIFYQYTFVMGKTDSSDAFILKEGERFVYYVIFTDFRDDSNFLDYRVLKTVSNYDGGYINMGITVFNGKVLLNIDGEMQYRRGLDDFTNSELVVSNTANMKAEVDSFDVKTNATEVEEIYNTKAAGHNDHFFGKTIGSTFNLGWTSEDYVNGAYSMRTEQANTATPGDNSKSSLVSIYKDGNPLYGNTWAVSGTLEVIYYSNNPHVVFYYYQDNNHQCRYLLNLNTYNNNNIIYYYVTNAEKENINSESDNLTEEEEAELLELIRNR